MTRETVIEIFCDICYRKKDNRAVIEKDGKDICLECLTIADRVNHIIPDADLVRSLLSELLEKWEQDAD